MNIPDELLAAYVNGELEGAERARIEQAIQYDARLAQRVAQQRARRARSLPQRLVQPIRSTATGSAQVIDLARVRAERKRRNERARGTLPRRLALVAGIAGGLLLGVVIDRLAPDSALTQYRDGALFAHGALADALNEQLTLSRPVAGNAIRVGMSFRAKRGNYCRTFSVRDSHALAGLACHEQDQWRVWTLDASEARGPSAHVVRSAAAGLPPAVAQAVDERISGSPLDAQAELSARRSGWR